MLAYLQKRALHSLVVLLIICSLTFVLVRLAPGLPQIMTGDLLTNEDRMLFQKNLGLDRPIHEQYLIWWSHVIRGDFGESWTERAPVMSVLLNRLPNTLILAGAALLISIVVGIPVGIFSAVRRYTLPDYLLTTFTFLGLAVPNFWLGLILILLFSVHWQVLPSAGMYTIGTDPSLSDRLEHLILPSLVLASSTLAQLVRFTRSSMIEVLDLDYIRTARAKGLKEWAVLAHHGLRNAMIPVITIVGLQIPRFIGGSIVVESIFAWPGIGRLAYSSAITRDYPMIMGITIFVAMLVLVANVLTDILYTLVNPRIRLQ